MYYGFLLNMWVMAKITETKLRTYVPFYITQAECDMILLTPQVPQATVMTI